MLRNTDRFAPARERELKVGDRVRLPIALGERTVYRHSFEIVAFLAGQRGFDSPGLAHVAVVRRLADGFTKTLACHWIARYAAGADVLA